MSFNVSKKAVLSIASLVLFFSGASAQSETQVAADIWADNWFALYIDEELVKEDSVAFKTERSFNSESFIFAAELPVQAAVVMKDFYENDSGLEYIGGRRQQMGDGGFIAQFKNAETGALIDVSNTDWQCLAVHQAPLNKDCERSDNPSAECKALITEEPEGWMSASFDDSSWSSPKEYPASAVRPKHGYGTISWEPGAKFVWGDDLETDNIVLCRFTLEET